MITYTTGNLLESNAEAIVNTVNTMGVMGKGIALQFKKQFPVNYKLYRKACKEELVKIGEMFVTEEVSLIGGRKLIINFPTKTDWRKPSEYAYVEQGLQDLKRVILANKIRSIAIPPLGAGNGGLDWAKVKKLIVSQLSEVSCDIFIYEPSYAIPEILPREMVSLTPARAMLLAVMYDLVRQGEFVSEFAAEKIAYFLQRFGATEFKLDFRGKQYGPYSGKVKHVLYYLNGSYLKGYGSKDAPPFAMIDIIPAAETKVTAYLAQPENLRYQEIVERTQEFLKGFYSAFALELLSTIDFIMQDQKVNSVADISNCLRKWSNRKKSMFDNTRFIELAINNIKTHLGG